MVCFFCLLGSFFFCLGFYFFIFGFNCTLLFSFLSRLYRFFFPTIAVLPSPEVVQVVEDPSIIPVEVPYDGGNRGELSLGQKVVIYSIHIVVVGGLVVVMTWGWIEAWKYYFEYFGPHDWKPSTLGIPGWEKPNVEVIKPNN